MLSPKHLSGESQDLRVSSTLITSMPVGFSPMNPIFHLPHVCCYSVFPLQHILFDDCTAEWFKYLVSSNPHNKRDS